MIPDRSVNSQNNILDQQPPEGSDGRDYIELKELTRQVNHPMVSNSPTVSRNSHNRTHEDAFDGGLASSTHYRSLEWDPLESSFVDEANNTTPYSAQKRGYG